MHYERKGLYLHKHVILELVQAVNNNEQQGIDYSTTEESNHVSNTPMILGATLSSENINMGSMNIPYDKTNTNTINSHIMNHHPHIFPPQIRTNTMRKSYIKEKIKSSKQKNR